MASLSTTEAEFVTVTEAIKEAIWMLEMAGSLEEGSVAASVYCDGKSGIYLAKNQAHHERTKHIDVRLCFVRAIIARGEVKLEKVSTRENPGDMITKALAGPKFKYCLELLRIAEDKTQAKVEIIK